MRLQTFGALSIQGLDATAGHHVQRRQLALLAVLAAAGRAGATRDQLVALFWADTDAARARHSLDQSLYTVRRLVGADAVVAGAAGLTLDCGVVPSDVDEFQRALERADFGAAVGAYTGPFLDGVLLGGAPEFERWADRRRRDFARTYERSLTLLAAAATADRDFAAAAEYLRRAAASDPLSGTIAHALMVALDSAGQVSAAIDAGRVYAAMVRQELECEPDPAVSALMARLRARSVTGLESKVRDQGPEVRGQETPTAPATAWHANTADDGRSAGRSPASRRMWGRASLALGLAVVVTLGISTGMSKWRSSPHLAVSFHDRVQLTATGQASLPTVSRDGKTLAFATRICTASGCILDVDVQDIREGTSNSVLHGAARIYQIKASPDGHHLLVAGNINGVLGTFLASANGGPARFVTTGPADNLFSGRASFLGNDSLLVGPIAPLSDSVFWVSVTGLDGVARDSIRISAPGGRYFRGITEVPGTPWFVVGIAHDASFTPKWELRVIDRHGRERDHTMVQGGQLRASTDAIWIHPQALFPDPNRSIVRIPLDRRSGKIANVADTIYSGPFTAFDVTADGSRLVVDDGIAETSVYVMDLGEALRTDFGSLKPLLRESAPLVAWLFPNGQRLIVERDAKAAGSSGTWLSTLLVSTGVESPVTVKGTPIDMDLEDSVTLGLFEHDSSANHGPPISRFVLEDVRTHQRGEERTIADPGAWQMVRMPGGGWAWLGSDLRIHVQLPGDTAQRTYPIPSWYNRVEGITPSPDGRYLALVGWNAATVDSARVTVLSVADGVATPWVTMFAEDYQAGFLADGSFELCVAEPLDTWTIYRVHGPGRVDKVGVLPGPVWKVTTSTDLARAAVLTRDYRGTVWMFRVVRR